MAFTFLKTRPPTTEPEIPKIVIPSAGVEVTGIVETLAQEYLELHQQLEAIDAKDVLKRMDLLRKQLQLAANDLGKDEEPVIFSCPKGEVEFSPRREATEVGHPMLLVQMLAKKFGAEVAWGIVSVSVTGLSKLMSESEMKPFITKVPGPRSVREVRVKT